MEELQLVLYLPVREPINPTNLFGANPAEYEPLGQKGHPGLDFEAPSGTKVYAPCDGDAFYTTDVDGGCGIWIRTPNNAAPQANIILWHMYPKDIVGFPYQIPTDGSVTPVKAGQFLGYSDNSGAPKESTGPHLHLGVMPCDATGKASDPLNGYMGCIDPTPYLSKLFADEVQTAAQVVEESAQVVSLVQSATDAEIPHAEKLSILQQIEQFIQSLLP